MVKFGLHFIRHLSNVILLDISSSFMRIYFSPVGEYVGDDGEYCGLVGEYAGDDGEYCGLLGEY